MDGDPSDQMNKRYALIAALEEAIRLADDAEEHLAAAMIQSVLDLLAE